MPAPTISPASTDDDAPAARSAAPGEPRAGRVRALRDLATRRVTKAGPLLLGACAAAWAVVIGLAVPVAAMLVVWIGSASQDLGWQEAVRIGATIWSVAQTAPVVVAGVTYSLVPWGLALVSVALVAHAGGWALRRCADGRALTLAAVGAALTYCGLTAGVAALAGPGAVHVPVGRAAAHGLAVAVVGLVVASWRAGRLPVDLVPEVVRVAGRAGVVAAAVLLGTGALAAAAVLAVRIDDAAAMFTDLRTGAVGGLVLLVIAVGYVPVLAVWSASYVLGAGVVLGPAVVVSPFVAVTPVTSLPPFPLLAAVPTTASPIAWALPVVGVVAGVVAGVVVGRQAREQARSIRAGAALGAAVLAGGMLGALAALSSGSLGDLRLAHVGPSPVAVGVLAAIVVAVGAVPVAVLRGAPGRPDLAVARIDPADSGGHFDSLAPEQDPHPIEDPPA